MLRFVKIIIDTRLLDALTFQFSYEFVYWFCTSSSSTRCDSGGIHYCALFGSVRPV